MKKLIPFIILLTLLIALPQVVKATIETFYVDPYYDIKARQEVRGVLKLVTPYAYFYVEEDYLNALSESGLSLLNQALENLSQEFNKTIYSKMTAVYGSSGIERITILATPMKAGYRGYFVASLPADKTLIVYVNAGDITSSLAPAYLAHEFQHLINYNQKTRLGGVTEERWLNEALSEYAPTLCGYNNVYSGSYLSERVKDFIQSPYDPLGEWKESPADYASVSLFMHYLVGRFGEEIITGIMTGGLTGIASIEQALSNLLISDINRRVDIRYQQIFADWTVANYLNDADVTDFGGLSGKYGYNPDCCGKITFDKFHLSSQVTYSIYPATETESSFMIKDWAGSWYKFIPSGRLGPGRGDTLSIEFTGTLSSDFGASVIISDFEGNNEVRTFYITGGKGKFYVPSFGWEAAQVIFIPFNGFKQNDFTTYEPLTGFSFTARSEILASPVVNGNLWPEGSLIRASNTPEVYIVRGEVFKRWIQTPELFNMYGHFKWEDIIEAPIENVSSYQDASLIRKAGDYKVYEVNGDGTKHWLNITAEEFEKSGRKWNMIYEVNESEWEWYERGSDVLYR